MTGWRRTLVRWAFARFYQQGAWTYDLVAALISRGHWVPWILAVRPYLRGSTLELGCGTGHLQAALAAERPGQLTGLDLSSQMLHRTRRRLLRQGHAGALVRARGQQLPFGAARFDSVVATFPAEYILAPATISEVRRVLRAGGRFVILDAGQLPRGLYSRMVDLAYLLVFGRTAAPDAPRHDPRQQLLQAAGFEVAEQWESVGTSRIQVLLARLP